jgi:hypothetical protein
VVSAGLTAAEPAAPGELLCDEAGPLASDVVDSLAAPDGGTEAVDSVGAGESLVGVGVLLPVLSPGPAVGVCVGVGLLVGSAVPDGEGEDAPGAGVVGSVGDWDGVDVGVGAAEACAVADSPGGRRVPLCHARPT